MNINQPYIETRNPTKAKQKERRIMANIQARNDHSTVECVTHGVRPQKHGRRCKVIVGHRVKCKKCKEKLDVAIGITPEYCSFCGSSDIKITDILCGNILSIFMD